LFYMMANDLWNQRCCFFQSSQLHWLRPLGILRQGWCGQFCDIYWIGSVYSWQRTRNLISGPKPIILFCTSTEQQPTM
jgi:hypothetical protein